MAYKIIVNLREWRTWEREYVAYDTIVEETVWSIISQVQQVHLDVVWLSYDWLQLADEVVIATAITPETESWDSVWTLLAVYEPEPSPTWDNQSNTQNHVLPHTHYAVDILDLETILERKQDKLIPWANIQIAADWKTISATDTLYYAWENVTISSGNYINAVDTTYEDATQQLHGLMSAADKTKLDWIEAWAQVNTVTGVKWNAETWYRTGNINITKANIWLWNVDNTSDANKPISNATQAALDLKLNIADLPSNLSSFVNDWDWTNPFITKTANNLDNYYKKTETYNQTEINNLINSFGWFQVVATLPTSDIKTNIIYLLWPISTVTWTDKYQEWIYTTQWVMIWDTTVDLSNYMTLNSAQTVTAKKTFNVEPVLWTAKTTAATNSWTKFATEAQVYNVSQWLVTVDSSWVSWSINPVQSQLVQSALNAKANDSSVVHTSWAESIGWVKTFTSAPKVPSKTSAATNTGTAVATEAQVYTVAQDLVDAVADLQDAIDEKWDATDLNVKWFFLSGTSDLAGAQAAFDWYKAWKYPIIKYDGNFYYPRKTLASATVLTFYALFWASDFEKQDNNGRTIIQRPAIDFTHNGTTVSNVAISSWMDSANSFISPGATYTTPFTPTDPSHPATKQYVDWMVDSTAYNYSSWSADTTHAAAKSAIAAKINAMDSTISWKQAALSNITASEIQTGTATTQRTITAAVIKANLLRIDPNSPVKPKYIWIWTQAQYEALSSTDSTTLYFTTDA